MKEFAFKDCVEIKELLGKRADDVLKLMELIEEVSTDSIYYHTNGYFLRHFYIAGAYPNDFATWAAIQVRDRVLGEKLAGVTLSCEKSLEDIRIELLEIIDDHLSSCQRVPSSAGQGQPFYFMQSKIIEIPSGLVANNLHEFYEGLKKVDASAVYNHVFEARFRDKLARSDFALWLDQVQGKKELADRIENIDSYMYSLEGLRNKIIQFCAEDFL